MNHDEMVKKVIDYFKDKAAKPKNNKKLQTDNSRFVYPDNHMCCSCGKIFDYRFQADGCCT